VTPFFNVIISCVPYRFASQKEQLLKRTTHINMYVLERIEKINLFIYLPSNQLG
jgi:hypothetical protein